MTGVQTCALPIFIMQREVDVFENDTASEVAGKVLKEEHKIYPEAIKKVIEKLNKEV